MTTELLFYYESRQNPNGDPGFENQPRLMPDDTIMVTDVRIKRTMRDYAKNRLGQMLFVDYGKEGLPVKADTRAYEIADGDDDVMRAMLVKTFDVPLFGALVPMRKATKGSGGSEKLTGPMQFGLARSTNKVRIVNPTISGRFVGKEKGGGAEESSTLGKFYSVEYALIKVQGALSEANLGKWLEDKGILARFREKASMSFECLWRGTNDLITRSKYPQRSILYIEVDYRGRTYNDLPNLVSESGELRGYATQLGQKPFDFSRLVAALGNRSEYVAGIRLCGAADVADDIEKLKTDLDSLGLKTEVLQG